MPVERLRTFLDQNRIKYVVITHSPAYTAGEIARSAHISGRQMAKTVIVKLDGRLAMAVLPASELVDLDLLADAAFAQRADPPVRRGNALDATGPRNPRPPSAGD